MNQRDQDNSLRVPVREVHPDDYEDQQDTPEPRTGRGFGRPGRIVEKVSAAGPEDRSPLQA